jgi:TetR/AcrR family fatty acid metabolism transcriptional regulator
MVTRTEAKKMIILKAAAKVFAAKGYHYATVEDIAGEAGIAKGSIHAYFENKLDVLLTLLLLFWQSINAANAEKLSLTQDPVAALKSLFATFQNMLLNSEDSLFWGRILQEALPQLHTLKSQQLRTKQLAIGRQQRRLIKTIDSIIKAGQEKGRIQKTVPPEALRQILGGASQLLVYGLFTKSAGSSIGYSAQDVQTSLNQLIDTYAL